MGRLVNTVANFLAATIPESGVRATLREVLERASGAAHRIPAPERLVPSSRQTVLDLTSSLYMARSVHHHGLIIAALRHSNLPVLTFRGRPLATHCAVTLLLRGLHDLLGAWSQEAVLTEAD